MRNTNFSEKVVLVTGAGQGIGSATACRFAEEGALVGILDLNKKTADQTLHEIETRGGKGITLVADVADPVQVQEVVNQLASERGKIDILVNNAGFDRPGGFLKLVPNDFSDVFGVHLFGAIHCSKACIPFMLKTGRGAIVNVSSIYGKSGSKGESAYSTAKAGLIGLTKSLAKEFGSKGIRVNVVLPGLTNTPTIRDFMQDKFKEAIISETPLGRAAEASEIASAIRFLASDEAAFITGATLDVSGGWNM
jgi:NAD(P)-dependent dehydrogenase (short-subunit alcohol dehydrogenase family)